MKQKHIDAYNARLAEYRARMGDVKVLAFCRPEWPASGGRYHAMGLYLKPDGMLAVRWLNDDFYTRVPGDAIELWIATMYSVPSNEDGTPDEIRILSQIEGQWGTLPQEIQGAIDADKLYRASEVKTNA